MWLGLSPGSLWRLPPQHRGIPRGRLRWRAAVYTIAVAYTVAAACIVVAERYRLCRLMNRCERRFKALAKPSLSVRSSEAERAERSN
jgi:hypothetical protein